MHRFNASLHVDQVLRLQAQGLSCKQIAPRVGVGSSRVAQILRAHGLRAEKYEGFDIGGGGRGRRTAQPTGWRGLDV